MAESKQPLKWFCRSTPTDVVQGPFALVELAGLLRAGDITGNTLTRAEGDDAWIPFQSRREFDSARNMPAEVIYQHLKDEAAEEIDSPWSLRRLYYLGTFVLGTLVYGLFSWHRYHFWSFGAFWR